jgi:hypothetical protein
MAALVDQPLKDEDGPDSFNVLPALTGSPKEQIRDHLVLSPLRKENLTLRKGKWVYIDARGSGGFSGKLETDYERGGPGAHLLTQQINSDIENGRFKEDAPPAQLYDLEADRSQTTNLYNQYPGIVREMKALLEECKKAKRTAPKRS